MPEMVGRQTLRTLDISTIILMVDQVLEESCIGEKQHREQP